MRRPQGRVAAVCLAAILTGAVPVARRGAQAAEPTTAACLASYEESLTLKKRHALRASRAELLVCSSASCPLDVRGECIERVHEVDLATPTIVFAAKDEAGNDLFDVSVTMDGEKLAARLDGTALPLDPGAHTFTFDAARKQTLRKQLVISEGQKARRELITFEAPAPKSPLATALGLPAGAVVIAPSPNAEPIRDRNGERRLGRGAVAAIALGAVGVAAVGVGTTYGFIALSRKDRANGVCPHNPCGNSAGPGLWDEAASAGNISTAAFVAGGAAIAAGAAVWMLGKRKPDATPNPQLTVGLGSVHLSGSW
jgi:hypothetical protein